ncbi:MAG TPA: response regulator [Xanthobacteraceae bacterium]|nr:response regulator [Xanthobacteraceae bacterium]
MAGDLRRGTSLSPAFQSRDQNNTCVVDVEKKNNPMGTPMAVKVLVVEDESLVRMVAVDALRDAGFEVLEAADGERALDLYNSAPVDVLFTDIRLSGGMSGWEVAEQCRSANPALPVIYASAVASAPPRPVRESIWFQKPYTAEQVVTVVQAVADAAQLRCTSDDNAAPHRCAQCGSAMRVMRVVANFGQCGEIKSYACERCGAIITLPERR